MSCSNCCGSSLTKKRPSNNLALKPPAATTTTTKRKQKKSRSISWECLPFSTRSKKQNVNKQQTQLGAIPSSPTNSNAVISKTNSSKIKNSENHSIPNKKLQNNVKSIESKSNQTNNINQQIQPQPQLTSDRSTSSSLSQNTKSIEENSNKTSSVASSSNSASLMSENESSVRNTSSSRTNHHPYATSLVNSGFGFGFDLQGGEIDNQLTFIINVQPNGDAARKGLADGDILVSIQGKNVIGIRRTAIERILKQYKVDQEIEIVVCRLKDPSFILNLSKLITQQQQQQQQLHNSSTSFDSVKFRNLNEQIFNELAHFEDKSYKKSAGLISNMKRSIRKEIFYEEKASSSKLRQKCEDKKYVSETQISLENTNSTTNGNKPILISVPINTSTTSRPYAAVAASAAASSSNNAYNLNESNLISIELNKINKQNETNNSSSPQKQKQTPLPIQSMSYTNQETNNNIPKTLSSIINSPAHNQFSTHDSGVYNESSSRKSNKSTSYYSDISIVVYDNVANITSSINSGVNSVSLINSNDKRTIIASSSSSSSGFNTSKDRMILSVTQQQQPQNSLHRRSSTIHPNIMSSTRSVNDFTGSIIAADRVNFFNKQVAESSKLNKNINNDSIYSSVIKKEYKNRPPAVSSSDLTISQPIQQPQPQQQRISICTLAKNEMKPSNSNSFLPITIQESVANKKRSTSEAVNLKTEPETTPSNEVVIQREIDLKSDHSSNNFIEMLHEKRPSPVIVDEFSSSKFKKPNLVVNKLNNVNTKMNSNNELNDVTSIQVTSEAKPPSKIEQRLLELEKIAKNNIKQLEKFEQKYSSSLVSSSYSINKTVSNAHDSTTTMSTTTKKSYETQTSRVSQSSYEIPIDIQLEEVTDDTKPINKNACQTTNVETKLDKQKRLLEEVNFKPYVKQRLAEFNNNLIDTFKNTTTTTTNSSNKTLAKSSNSLEASLASSTASSTSSICNLSDTSKRKSTPPPSTTSKDLQTTIDIEIYNLEPKSKPTPQISQNLNEQRQTLTIMPRANRRSKQKPFKIECTEEHPVELKEITRHDSSIDNKKEYEEETSVSSQNEIDLIETKQESNQQEEIRKEDNQSVTLPEIMTPLKMDSSETSDAKSDDSPSSSRMSNEKHFKRSKPHHRFSQTCLINQTETKNDQSPQKVVKTKREALAHRRDRRSRHTIPFAHSQVATNYENVNLKELQEQMSKEVKLEKDDEKPLIQKENEKLENKQDEEELKIEKIEQVEETISLEKAKIELENTIDMNLNELNTKCSIGEVKSEIVAELANKQEDETISATVTITKDNLYREIKSDSENITSAHDATDETPSNVNIPAHNKRYSIGTPISNATLIPKPSFLPPDSLVNKSLRKKHDSTDTLDSASSYEIRFERPYYALNSKLDLEDVKASLWPINLDNVITPLPTSPTTTTTTIDNCGNPDIKQEEESLNDVNQSSPLQIESSILETDPLFIRASLEQNELDVNVLLTDDEKTKEVVSGELATSYDDDYSSSDMNQHPLNLKEDDSSLLVMQPNDDKFNNSSSSFRSVEISPRTKISNEISDDSMSDQLEMIKSVTQIINDSTTLISDQTKENNKLLDASCVSDSSNDVVSSLVDQVEMILLEKKDDLDENRKLLSSKTIENASNVLNAQSILDDGYGSTASMKNITNESCSSLDDAASEYNTHLEMTTQQSLLITKPSKKSNKLESLVDDSSIEMMPQLIQESNETKSTNLILEKTISFSSELTETTQINPQLDTDSKELTVLEELENSIKVVELEPVFQTDELKIEKTITSDVEVIKESIVKLEQEEKVVETNENVKEQEEEKEQTPIHLTKTELETNLDEKNKPEEKEELTMLQEPDIEVKTTNTGVINAKHSNGSAVVELPDHSFTDVPPIYDKLKSLTTVVAASLASPNKSVLPIRAQTDLTTSSGVPLVDKGLFEPSLNASLSNVQEDARSLSSNEYSNDQALSLSYPVQYKSTIAPRQTVISRRSNNDRVPALNQSQTLTLSAPISLRPLSSVNTVQSPAGSALKETRQREKKQLGELNDRFAGYVERVRFLEAQNKKLQTELSMLKGKWGQETKQIEKMYQIELEEARSVLNDTSKNKDSLQIKLDRYEQELEKIRKKYNEVEDTLEKDKSRISNLQDQIATNESEINLLRRRLADLQDEEKKYKQEIMRMMNEIQKVQFELENEMKQRLMLENDKQSLEEELVFLKEIHSKEIEELKHLSLQESGIDPTMFFKNELSNAIKEIREEYENLNQSQRAELEGWYRIKVEQAVAEIQRKQSQQPRDSHETDSLSRDQARKLQLQILDSKRNIGDLKAKNSELEIKIRELEEEIKREEMESNYQIANKDSEIKMLQEHLNRIISEYEELLTTKSDLEVEIRTYRKLLEGEENKDGLKQIVENIEHRTRGLTSSSNRSFQDTISAEKSSLQRVTSFTEKVIPSSYLAESQVGAQDESSVTDELEEKSSLTSNQYGQVLINIQYDQKKSVLVVNIKMAKDLICLDGKEANTTVSLDSFARIMIVPDRKKKTKRKTRIFKESINPTWNESFEFADMSLSDVRSKSIDLLVKNSKSLFSRDKSFLGQCVIQLNSIDNLEQGHTAWYQLQDQTFCSGLLKKLLD